MKPSFFSKTFAVVLFAIPLMDATYDRYNGEHVFKAPSVSTLDTREYSESILQDSEKDIVFIENLGQVTDTKGAIRPDILFFTRSEGVDMYMTTSGLSYVFRNAESGYYRLDMEFVGMNRDITIKKEFAVDQQFHYYTPECPEGVSPRAYKKITMENIYEGIDLVYYEKEGRMKYDFILKAGADAGKIKMKYKGAGSMNIDNNGDVIITTPMGEIREGAPYTYASTTGSEIESTYRIKNNTVLFDLAEYDKSEDIIIDPVRQWATYYGGSGYERGLGICTDNSGNLYVTGYTDSPNFPTLSLTGAYNQTTYGGGTYDAFILKFDPYGERIWATYYGGSDKDIGNGMCTDDLNNLYVLGKTNSTDFPTQPLTGAYNQTTFGDTLDVFILKFDSDGVRQWATYYGGNDLDKGFKVCTDGSNNLYVTGETKSTDFPTQSLAGAYNQTTSGGEADLFILKFNSNGARQWATYYGGSGDDGQYGCNANAVGDICTDGSGNLYLTASTESFDFPVQSFPGAYNQSTKNDSIYTDIIILKFDSNGVRQWATYYGGRAWDEGCGIATDHSGALYVTGHTMSPNDFPTQFLEGAYNQAELAGGSDAYILKFDSNGVRLWATCYGGFNGNHEKANKIAIDNSGNLYIIGSAQQLMFVSRFPTYYLEGAYNQDTHGGGEWDAFILMFNKNGERRWATFYGGSDHDQALGCCTDNSGNFYVTGPTGSGDFPSQPLTGAYNQSTSGGAQDVFILKFEPYCRSYGISTENEWIQTLTMGTYTNNSGDNGGYLDNTTNPVSVESGQSYSFTGTPGFSGKSRREFWRVWIDLNFDGDFSDDGEEVFAANGERGTVSGSISIPEGLSDETRMRVSMKYNAAPDPCEQFTYGEVEDYTLTFTPPEPQPPAAGFSGDPTSLYEGETVQFTDLSSNNPTSWSWSFPGGTPSTSTSQNPLITYNTAGTYSVTLTATNGDGSDTHTETDYITVSVYVPQPPVADFSGDPTSLYEGETVQFTDLSSNDPTSWAWTFAGGTPSSSTEQNPTVIYDTEGTYAVSLTVTNAEGSDTKTAEDYITVNPAGPTTYCESSSQSNALEWIARVDIDGFSNPSEASFYTDFTSLTVDLTPGSSSSITLTPYYTDKDQREFWRVWIDYNLDGDFEDADETVVIANNKKGAYSTNFTIPSYASGQTRMRVSMKNGSSPSSCETFGGGEVEDYTVDFAGFKSENISRTYNKDMVIFPNPNNGSFQVMIDKDIHPEARLRVYDMRGILLYDMPVKQSYFKIDLSGLAVGIYQISIFNGNEYYYSKLVKQ